MEGVTGESMQIDVQPSKLSSIGAGDSSELSTISVRVKGAMLSKQQKIQKSGGRCKESGQSSVLNSILIATELVSKGNLDVTPPPRILLERQPPGYQYLDTTPPLENF